MTSASLFFNLNRLLNNRLFYEKHIQLSTSTSIRIGITPIPETVSDKLLDFNEVMIFENSADSLTIFGENDIISISNQIKYFHLDSDYFSNSSMNNGDFRVSDHNGELVINRNGNEVRLNKNETGRFKMVVSLIGDHFTKYNSVHADIFFSMCISSHYKELLTEPMDEIYYHEDGESIREMMIEIVFKFFDFFKLIVTILTTQNFIIAE